MEVYNKITGVKANKLLSKRILKLKKMGLAMVLGNYINTLFVSADKQFVKWFWKSRVCVLFIWNVNAVFDDCVYYFDCTAIISSNGTREI